MQRTLLLFMLISLAYTVQSQDQKVKLGLHAGPNLLILKGEQLVRDHPKFKRDLAIGIDLEIPVGTRMSIKTGLEYEGKAQIITFPAYDGNGIPIGTAKVNVGLDYLQIPLYASYRFPSGKTKVFADLGTYVGYLLSSDMLQRPISAFDGTLSITSGGQSNFDFGIITGLGFAFPISNKIEGAIAIQDHLGLTNVNKPNVGHRKARTHTIGLRLGTMLSI